MSFDFRASQLQFGKLIASGSTGTGASVLLYPISAQDQSNPNQGYIDNTKFSFEGIGSDIFLFVSGAIGSKNIGDSHGVAVFGGDVVISGNLTVIGTGGGGGGGGSSTGSADISASYVVISLTSSMPNERSLAAGNLTSITDGGPGSTVTIASTLPSDLLTRIPDKNAFYLTVGNTASLPNERALTVGDGLFAIDQGAGSGYKISAPFWASEFVTLASTASLPNERVLTAGDGISIVTGSPGGLVTISVTSASALVNQFATISASYLVVGLTGTLPHERAFTVGDGLFIVDGGSNGNFKVSAPFYASQFVTLSPTASMPNERVLTAGDGISITDGGAGASVVISVISSSVQESQFAPVSASYLVLANTGTLPNERRFVAGDGILAIDGGANGDYRISAPFYASQFVTFALTSTLPNERLLVAGDGISITDGGAGGNLTISALSASAFGDQFADVSASFIVVGLTASLANERRLVGGVGVVITDGGAGNSISVTTPFVSASFVVFGGATALLPNERNLQAGDGISITDGGPGGTLLISSSFGVGQFAEISASFLTINNTGSLPNERKLTAGDGIAFVDTGANGNLVVSSAFNVSSAFVVVGGVGNYPGQRTLAPGNGISITDNGAGNSVLISVISSSTVWADLSASYLVISGTSSLPNERTLVAGPGITFSDNGPGLGFVISSSIMTASNLGTGSLIYSGSSGENPKDFRFFTVIGARGITVENSGAYLIISGGGAGGTGSVSGTNLGSGSAVLADVVAGTPTEIKFRTIIGSGSTSIFATTDHVVVGGDNFSFTTVESGTQIKIKPNQQMIVYDTLTVDGDIEVNGTIVHIDDRKSAGALILANGDEVVISGSNTPVSGNVLTSISPLLAIWAPLPDSADIIFSLTGSTGATTSSIVIGSDLPIENFGSNLKFFVSGNASFTDNVTISGSSDISGSLNVYGTFKVSRSIETASDLSVTGTVRFGADHTRIFRDGDDLKFFDSNNPAGYTLTQLGAAGGGGGGGASVTRQNAAGYYTTTNLSGSPQVIGGLYFNPSQHNSGSIRLYTILSTITGSDEAKLFMYNITSGSFVAIGGPGVDFLTCSSLIPTAINSAQLLSAQNFDIVSASVYELRLHTASGSRAIHHNSEIVCT